jgi:hypothetical protein
MPAIAAILEQILQGLLAGAANKAGGAAFGWFLSFIGLGGNDAQFVEIEQQLAALQNQVAQLETEIQSLIKELLQQLNWDTLLTAIEDSVTDIESHYQTFQQLEQTDTTTCGELDQWAGQYAATELAQISATLLDGQGGLNPGDPGLIRSFALAVSQTSIGDAAYAPGNFSASGPIATYYQIIEKYFLYLVSVQLKGTTLLVNHHTLHGETNLAQDVMALYQANLALQCQTFISAVEAFTVNYAVDGSLLDMFGIPGNYDPIRQAGLTSDAISVTSTVHARFWMGNAIGFGALPPFQPFSTVGVFVPLGFSQNPISASAGNVLQLYNPQSGTAIAPDMYGAQPANYTEFPISNDCRWVMIHFSWTTPAIPGTAAIEPGLYRICLGDQVITTWYIENQAVCNALIQPSASGQYYTNGNGSFPIGPQYPANRIYANYTGRTSFGTGNSACACAGQIATDVVNFGTGDFSVECWFSLNYTPGSQTYLLSNKSAFGINDNDEGTNGLTGFQLGIQPSAGDSCALSFVVDDGLGNPSSFTADPHDFAPATSAWFHVAAMREGSSLKIYLNGNLQKGTSSGGDPSQLDLAYCFNLMFNSMNGSDPMTWYEYQPLAVCPANLARVAVWQAALQPAEILQHMTQGIDPQSAGLSGYWPFEDGTPFPDGHGKVSDDALTFIQMNSGSYLPAPAGDTAAPAAVTAAGAG